MRHADMNTSHVKALRFLVKELGLRPLKLFSYMLLGFLAVFAEAFGLGLIVPILEFVRLGSSVTDQSGESIFLEKVQLIYEFVGLNPTLPLLLATFFFTVVTRQIFDFFYGMKLASLQLDVQHDLRRRVFKKSQNADFKTHKSISVGRYITSMEIQIEECSGLITGYLRQSRHLFVFLTYSLVMIISSPYFTVLGIVQFLLIATLLNSFVRYTRTISSQIIHHRTALTSFFSETHAAYRTVRLFKLETKQREVLGQLSSNFRDATERLFKASYKMPLYFGIFLGFAIAVQVYIGSVYLSVEVTTLTFFMIVLLRLAPSAQSFMKQRQGLARQLAAFEEVFNVSKLFQQNRIYKHEGKSFEAISYLKVENISFKHDEGHPNIIDNFSATFKAGEITLLSGPSGVGKSTLLDLLSGLLQPTAGKIYFNGKPFSSLNSDWLIDITSYASQQVFLFNGNFEENICLNKRFDGVWFENVVEMSGAGELLTRNSTRKNFQIEASGSNLSGGQKQRIALARSLYKRPLVLLLDEPTSALDDQVDSKLMSELEKYTKNTGIVTILVSHNPKHKKFAGKIVTME